MEIKFPNLCFILAEPIFATLYPNNLILKEKSKSTPRARFEALAVGIALALQERSDLKVDYNAWIDEEDFSLVTRSDAANNKTKLKKRIDFVKNKLVGE